MSQSFRTVKQEYGIHSSQFLDRDTLLALISDVAARADTSSSEAEYGDGIEVYIDSGKQFLDYVQRDKRFTVASLTDSLGESGCDDPNADDMQSVIGNMKALAEEWRKSVNSDGSLVFVLD